MIRKLYFKEKFYEDGLYPEPKEYPLELVSKHLKPINYDRGAELYWMKQLEEELTVKVERAFGMPKSLQIFFARASSISTCRGTVDVLPFAVL